MFKKKACRVCKNSFTPTRAIQPACNLECSLKYADRVLAQSKVKLAKEEKAQDRARKAAMKPRSQWLKEAQEAFNAFVRKQDEFRGCISCGTNNGKMNAGHYRSVGANPELRFEPLNVHKQCERCNTYLHGNLLGYRAGLKGRISEESLEWLEGPHPAKHYSIDDLKAIKTKYRALARQLEKQE